MRLFFIWAFLLLSAYTSSAQSYIKNKEYYHELVNGVKLMVIQDAAAVDTRIILTVNAGTSYESKDAQGASMIAAAIAWKQLNTPGIEKKVFLHNDYTNYFLTFKGNNDISGAFASLTNAMTYMPKDSTEILNAPVQNVVNNTSASKFNDAKHKAAHFIYGENVNRLGIAPMDTLIKELPFKKVLSFRKTFYCPQNTYIIVYGNYDHNKVYEALLNNMVAWKDCAYSAALNMPATFIRSNGLNSQLNNFSETDSTIHLSLMQPAPATINSRKDVLCAMLFSKLISDSASSVSTFIKDSLKISGTEYLFTPAKYTCTSEFNFRLDTASVKQFLSSYSQLEFLKDSLLYADSNLVHAKKILNSAFDNYPDTTAYLFAIARYMSLTSLDHFSKLTDSVNAISQSDMTKFVTRYIADNSFTAILNIPKAAYDTLGIDSIYAETAATASAYEFSFAKNTNTLQMLIGDSIVPYNYDSLLSSLAQWIKINSKVIVRISGVATDDELLSVRDDAMISFFKSQPGFQFAPESLIPTKKIRLDVYRSMTVVKALVDKGVSIKQLTGTGRLLNAIDAKKEPGQRVYCNIKDL